MKKTRSDFVFETICYIFIVLLTLIVLYPVLYVIASSFSSKEALGQGKVFLWPVDFSLAGYKAVFSYKYIWVGYANTIFYTVVGTAMNVIVTMCCAYPLARKDLAGKSFFMKFFAFTMIFSGGMIPNYILMRNLNLINTRWAMLLPSLMSVYNMVVARTFIQSNIANEILESAKLDGCDDIHFFFKMVLPLSKSILAVLALWYAVAHWNAYFDAFLYLSDKDLYPLQIFLKDILVNSQIAADFEADQDLFFILQLKYALIVVATAPLCLAYPLAQKHFVKGVTVGSVKG